MLGNTDLEMYLTQKEVTRASLDVFPDLPVIEELDTLATMEVLSKDTDSLACRKITVMDIYMKS